jgi:hypothetical protein
MLINLAIIVVTAYAIWYIIKNTVSTKSKCTGDCNQGRNCTCYNK